MGTAAHDEPPRAKARLDEPSESRIYWSGMRTNNVDAPWPRAIVRRPRGVEGEPPEGDDEGPRRLRSRCYPRGGPGGVRLKWMSAKCAAARAARYAESGIS